MSASGETPNPDDAMAMRQIEQQARLARRLELSGWDTTRYRLAPVWIANLITERDGTRADALVITVMGAHIQAPTGEEAKLALAGADLVVHEVKFDQAETTRRLRAVGLDDEMISAANTFTWLTDGSLFERDDFRWRVLNEDHERDYEKLRARHHLMLNLALHRAVAMQMVERAERAERSGPVAPQTPPETLQ